MRQRLCRQLPLARDGNHTAQTHSSHCVYVPVTAAMLQMRAASTLTRSNSVRPSAAHPGSDARPLFIDLPGKGLALRAQRSNLDKFLQSNAAAYAELPYLPWTKPAHKSGIATEIVSSKLDGCAGLRGVTLVQDLITGDRDVPLLYYSGLLMNEAMYQQFADEYHCPTALELPSLAYTDARTAQRLRRRILNTETPPLQAPSSTTECTAVSRVSSVRDASSFAAVVFVSLTACGAVRAQPTASCSR
jgi:hypothetical protein